MQKEKRGSGRGRHAIVLLLLAVCLLLAAIACALALRLYQRSDPSLVGNWRMQVDLTETVRARANAWLQGADLGDQVDAGGALPRISVPVLLTLREDGSWTRQVEEAGYAAAEAEAIRALAVSLRELVRLRIADAGRRIENDEEAERRIQDAVGLSGEAYLSDYGPALLPELAELREVYDGGGAWQIEGGRIRLDGRTARYLADERLLVLKGDDGTEVYERVGS